MPAKYPLSLCIAALPLVSAFERIAGFSPASNVVDYAALDLDMERIIYYLEKKDPSDYDRVYKIYTQGGSSESTATITFSEGQDAIKRGDTVTGFNEAGSGSSTGTNEATGQVVYVNPVATSIRIEYTVPEKNELSHAGCRVGGLAPEDHITDGCFKISNGLTIGGNLYYPNSIDNTKAGRTLQELSLVTTDKMRSCSIGCPYWLFLQYADWYGDDDYGDKFVKAAIGTPETSFQPNKIGFTKHDMDFSNAERKARFELIEKGIMQLNVWMCVATAAVQISCMPPPLCVQTSRKRCACATDHLPRTRAARTSAQVRVPHADGGERPVPAQLHRLQRRFGALVGRCRRLLHRIPRGRRGRSRGGQVSAQPGRQALPQFPDVRTRGR